MTNDRRFAKTIRPGSPETDTPAPEEGIGQAPVVVDARIPTVLGATGPAARLGGEGRPLPGTANRSDAVVQEGEGEAHAPLGETAGVDPELLECLRPSEIVARLDGYIIGQAAAKRALAVALRNRYRRQRVADELRDDVLPKNILMIGPTGVGKTEMARRLARMTNSPFLKVEATKFTEVGYVGRDVESIVRDLLEQTITEVHGARTAEVEERARMLAEERILDVLAAAERKKSTATPAAEREAEGSTGSDTATPPAPAVVEREAQARRRQRSRRKRLQRKLLARQLEDLWVEVEIEETYQPSIEPSGGAGNEELSSSLADLFSQVVPPRKRVKRMTVADARAALVQEETDRLIDVDRLYDDAIQLVENQGIVFLDEVDKIAGQGSEHGPDISGEGVQRDLLPLLEGSTVHSRYGSVRTDHILFVAAGAFTTSRPSDLIPEFQGRFPIRVELSSLDESELERILVEPDNALTKQYAALLGTEGVTLEFTEQGRREVAHQAATVNRQDENIGARRLFTILEKVLEDVSFRAEEFVGQTVTIDAAYVRERLGDLIRNDDLRRYVL